MARQGITVDGVPPVSTFSPGVVDGGIFQVSGQGSLDPQTGEVVHLDDVKAQTRLALSNVERILDACGAGFGDVLILRAYLADRALFGAFNQAYEEFLVPRLGGTAAPARTTVMVTLPLEGMLVEIDALGVTRNA